MDNLVRVRGNFRVPSEFTCYNSVTCHFSSLKLRWRFSFSQVTFNISDFPSSRDMQGAEGHLCIFSFTMQSPFTNALVLACQVRSVTSGVTVDPDVNHLFSLHKGRSMLFCLLFCDLVSTATIFLSMKVV